jgi:hypothetical protein
VTGWPVLAGAALAGAGVGSADGAAGGGLAFAVGAPWTCEPIRPEELKAAS